jgi:predicted nuclease with TOPRIM domain
MMPVNSVEDLKKISLTQRFEGLTITVLNDGNPQDYWLVGGITNGCWVKKSFGNNSEKVQELETKIETEIKDREASINSLQERLNNLSKLQETVNNNSADIDKLKGDLSTIEAKVDALTSAGEGLIPDNETIGITNDDSKSLHVKILEKEGNILKKEKNENGESGLYATIPVFFEDEELN